MPPEVILAKLCKVYADRAEYKPYYYDLEIENVVVEIPVDALRMEGEDVVLSIEGLAALLNTLATPLKQMHDTYVRTRGIRN